MFSKAGIKRFNDVRSCAPPPGAYNPKLPEVASSAGISFQKSDRFPSGQFAVPLTPTGSRELRTPDCRRHNGSGSRITAVSQHSMPRRMNKMCQARSSSTFSLPVTLDGSNYTPGDEEFNIHRGKFGSKEELESELGDLQSELTHMREIVQTTEADRDALHKKVEDVKQDLIAAETRVVESEQALAVVEAREQEKLKQLIDQQSKIDTLEGCLAAAKHQQQVLQSKNEELQSQKLALKSKNEELLNQKLILDKKNEELLNLQHALEAKNEEVQNLQRLLEATKEELQNQEQLAQAKNQELQKQQRILEAKNQELQNQLQLMEANNEELRKANENLITQDLQKMTSMLQNEQKERAAIELELTRNLEAVEQKLMHAEQEIACTQGDFRRAEEEKKELSQRLENLSQQLEMSDVQMAEMEKSVSLAAAQLRAYQQKELEYHGQLANVQEFLKASEEEKELLQNQIVTMKQNFEVTENRLSDLEKALEISEAREKEKSTKLELQDQVISLVDVKLAEAHKELTEIGVTNEKLQEMVDDLLAQNHTKSSELVQLNEKLQVSLRQSQELEARLDEKTSEFNNIQNELQQVFSLLQHERGERAMAEDVLKSELETCRGKVECLYSELATLQDFSKQADEENAGLHKRLEEYSTNLAAGTSRIAQLEQDLAYAESSDKAKEEKIFQLKSMADEMETALIVANENLGAAQTKNSEMGDAITDLSTKNANLSAEVAKLNEELHTSQNHSNELDSALMEHQSKLIESQRQLQDTLSLLETERSDRARVESQLKSEIDGLVERVAQTDSEVAAMQNNLLKSEEEKDSLRLDIEKFKGVEEERNLLSQNLQDLQEQMTAMESEIKGLKQALTSAELSDQEKEDKIYCQQSKIEVIEENLEAANREISHLQTQNGELHNSNVDLQLKLTDQSIEVAQLKDDLDVRQCQSNELKAHLDDQAVKLSEAQNELEQTLSLLQNERNEQAATVARLNSELEASNKRLAAAVQEGGEWKDRYESAAEEKERHIQRLKMAEAKLGDYLNYQIKIANQAADMRKSSIEALVLKESLSKLEEQAKSSKQKLAAIEVKMAKQISSSKLLQAEVEMTRAERVQSQETIRRQESQIKNLESQNASLEKLIGPFKEQLKVYKDHLDVEHDAAARQARYAQEIAEKYADIVGHQNPKQRIHHMQKLKNDNLTLKKDNSELQKRLTTALKRLQDLEDRCGKLAASSSGRRFDPRQAFRHQDQEDTQNIAPF